MGKIVFILGGARSGKSRFAQQRAQEIGPRVTYIATAEAGDAEMAERIAQHQKDRPPTWRTLEAPRALAAALQECLADSDAVVVDCLTLFLSNVLAAHPADPKRAVAQALAEVDQVLAVARQATATVILVSNEVGMGLVPAYPLGRSFRDLAGVANQRVATAADEVYLVVASLPLQLK